ncbi:MAG: ATP-binding cassette domain-containing protein [Desulfobacteraceae bacterium]|nr:ATP-binding cassette domain-containing protein [Desulfobacteraceae bacterium]
MICANNIALAYGKQVLFKDVNIMFKPGNCYGLIGANGAGKSTFLKILAKEIEPDAGDISVGPKERIAVLRQDHFAFDTHRVLDTVIMGHEKLYSIMAEREALYAKPDFSNEDGLRSGELEIEFEEMNGYDAESEAAVLLKNLGISENLHGRKMKELEGGEKVRVLLAQALFGNPDVLLLDEPTNNLDILSIAWLEDFLFRFKNTVIVVSQERPCGNIILEVEGLSKTIDGEKLLDNVSFTVNKKDKIAFMGNNSLAKTTLFQIIAGEMEPDNGSYRWGTTISHSYFPKEHQGYFNRNLNLIEWLLQFAPPKEGESFARTFLGRMLFSGEDALKTTDVLSGGEKVRCMLSRMMLAQSNALILDEPTNHLDLESITALNNSLIDFPEVVLFTSHDHEFVNTVVNRVIELTPTGIIDRLMTFEAYVESAEVAKTRELLVKKAA